MSASRAAEGQAPGVPKQLSRDSVGRGQLDTRGYSRGQKPSVSMLAALVRRVTYLLWRLIDELAPALCAGPVRDEPEVVNQVRVTD